MSILHRYLWFREDNLFKASQIDVERSSTPADDGHISARANRTVIILSVNK